MYQQLAEATTAIGNAAVVLMRFCTDAFFASQIHRIAIHPGLAVMDNSAGVAAVLARACRGRRGHLSRRQLRAADGEFDACVFSYNNFANWTTLLCFVKI